MRKEKSYGGIPTMKTYNITLFVLALCIMGCTSLSSGFSGKEDIHGLVIDASNKPVSGYCLTINNETIFTNETGMFTIEKIAAGSYHLFGYSEGYISINKNVKIINKNALLYIRVFSIDEIIEQSESLFKSGEWIEAEKIIAQALPAVSNGKHVRHDVIYFYYALTLYKQEKYDNALAALSKVGKEHRATQYFKNTLTVSPNKQNNEENEE
jgi:hypothetical protein